MTKDEFLNTVKAVAAAPSCCKEAKEACENYINAFGTDSEDAAKDALISELKEDVCTIDNFIALTASEHGKAIFGDNAGKMNLAGKKAKEQGGKYCLCDACQNGGKILDSLK